jgi:hypothetical protein
MDPIPATVPLAQGGLIALEPLRRALTAEGIEVLLACPPGEPSCGTKFQLAVAREDLDRAIAVLDQHRLSGMDEVERRAAARVADFDAAETTCPACEAVFSTAAKRCPDCGLNFGE